MSSATATAAPVPPGTILSFFPEPGEDRYPSISFEEYLRELEQVLEEVRRHPYFDAETVAHVENAYGALTILYQENTPINYYLAFSAKTMAKGYLPVRIRVDLSRRMTYFYLEPICRELHEPAFKLIDYLVERGFSDNEVDGHSYMDEAKMAILFTKKPFQDEVARLGIPEEALQELFLVTFREMVFSNEYPEGSD